MGTRRPSVVTGRKPRFGSRTDFEALLSGAKAGNGWAFDELFGLWNQPLTAFIASSGVVDVDDVVNETFLGVFRSITRFKGTEPQFRSWIFRVARNKVADSFRSAGRRPTTTRLAGHVDVIGGDVETDAMESLGGQRVDIILSTLTATQREVILLRIVADLTIKQVADVVKRRPGAVKQLQRRALRHLEDKLAAGEFDPSVPRRRPTIDCDNSDD